MLAYSPEVCRNATSSNEKELLENSTEYVQNSTENAFVALTCYVCLVCVLCAASASLSPAGRYGTGR